MHIPCPRADHGASAETCDELRQGRSSSVCRVTCKQRSKRALDYGGWTLCFAVLFTDLLYSREADLSVSSSLSRVRVMEARFDCDILQLLKRARAIGGVMFSREAWVVRSNSVIGPCCSRHHIAKGTLRGGGLRLEMVPSPAPAPRRGIIRSQTRSVCFLM